MPQVKSLPTGSELKTLREALFLSQDKFAAQVGISKRTVQSLEAGNRPGFETARRLLRWLEAAEEAA